MSFAKAKLKRFNDITVSTPPPIKYNVFTPGKKGKTDVNSQIERFFKKIVTPPPSEINSVQSTPCFQTPNVPKKKKFLGLSTTKSKVSNAEVLRDKIVECTNKDAYIQELTEQLEDLKIQSARKQTEVKNEFETLEKECEEIRKSEEQLMLENNIVIEENKSLKDQIERAVKMSETLSQEYQKKQYNLEQLKNYQSKKITEQNEELELLKSDLADLESQNKDLIKTIAEKNVLIEQHNKDLALYKKQLDEEKIELTSTVDHLKKQLAEEKSEKETFQKKFQEQSDKIDLMQENFDETKVLYELQTKESIQEIESSWKLKFEEQEKRHDAILKECQAISEYSIMQCEMEKTGVKNELFQKNEAYNCLKMEYDEIANRLRTQELTIEELKRALMDNGNLLSYADIDILAYEISIKSFRSTIDVLKKRLLNSDRDVMQLKDELQDAEERMLIYQDQINDLSQQLNQARRINGELEMESICAQKSIISEVRHIESTLHSRIDDKLDEICETLQKDIETLSAEKSSLVEQIQSLEKQLEKETEEAAEVRKKYIEISGKYDQLSQSYEENLRELTDSRMSFKSMQPFKEQFENCSKTLSFLHEEDIKELGRKIEEAIEDQWIKNISPKIDDINCTSDQRLHFEQIKRQRTALLKENDELRKQVKAKNMPKNKENRTSHSSNGFRSPLVLKNKN